MTVPYLITEGLGSFGANTISFNITEGLGSGSAPPPSIGSQGIRWHGHFIGVAQGLGNMIFLTLGLDKFIELMRG